MRELDSVGTVPRRIGAATRPLGAIDPCAINLHVASTSGYIDEQTGRPAVVRVNLGAYGGTPWAEKTPTGSALILR